VTGSGTQDKITKWTGTSAVGDSTMTESGGNVGIGTSTPAAQLHITQQLRIDGTDLAGYRAIGFGGNQNGLNPTIYSNGQYLVLNGSSGSRLYLNFDNHPGSTNIQANGGNVGIGTITPVTLLHLRVKNGDLIQRFSNAGNAGGELDLRYRFESAHHRMGVTDTSGNWLFYTEYANPNSAAVGYFPGSLGIGTSVPAEKLHVLGNATFTGTVTGANIRANYQDVAEWVPARDSISAGVVVIIDPDHSNHVIPSTFAYDTRVAGVISDQPGLLLGEEAEGKVKVATTGRVRVKVDATRAPIRVGDLLVTSNKEGIAMRSEPIDLVGTRIHRPGTIIGKALESLTSGVGEILVLLSLQ
jgi:hypothetical protein